MTRLAAKRKIACPNCGSPQRFGTQTERFSKDQISEEMVTVFVACSKCRWGKTLFTGTDRQHKNWKLQQKRVIATIRQGTKNAI